MKLYAGLRVTLLCTSITRALFIVGDLIAGPSLSPFPIRSQLYLLSLTYLQQHVDFS
jgi:hypothetical protein